eukprot:1138119-Pelagomonas_calceolata.AAC.7
MLYMVCLRLMPETRLHVRAHTNTHTHTAAGSLPPQMLCIKTFLHSGCILHSVLAALLVRAHTSTTGALQRSSRQPQGPQAQEYLPSIRA